MIPPRVQTWEDAGDILDQGNTVKVNITDKLEQLKPPKEN